MIDAVEYFRDAGVRILQPVFGLNAAWPDPDTYDWREFDGVFASLLDRHPDARFLPRVLLDVPDWWRDRYPDELVACAAPVPDAPYRPIRRNPEGGWLWGLQPREPSFGSERYRADMQHLLSALIRHFEASPIRSRLAGLQIGAGIYGEWHYWVGQFCPDVSRPARKRLGDIPDLEARTGTTHGLLRNPARESDVIEFYRRFHEDLCAEMILEFARTVKAESEGRLLCGVFYTYLLENVFIHEMGHLAPQKILESKDIDFIASPYSYQGGNRPGRKRWEGEVVDGGGNLLGKARGVGGDGGYRVLWESLKRHGKLYFAELDATTYLEPKTPNEDGTGGSDVENELFMLGGEGTDTVEGTMRVLDRDLGQAFARGNGGWLFDFGPVLATKRSWYADRPLVERVARHLEIGGRRADLDLTSVAEIAAVYDAKSLFATQHQRGRPGKNAMCWFSSWFLDSQARALHRVGAPVDFLYRFDLAAADADRYRLFLMVNTFYLTDDERVRLRDLFRDSGCTVVWFYAPGYVTPDRLDLDAVADLTGFTLAETTPGPILVEAGVDDITFGVDETQSPRFRVTDDDAEILGRWSDTGEVAFASRSYDGYTSIYAGTAPLPPRILRHLAERSGTRLWSTEEDIVVATEDTGMCVATSGGERTVSLHKPLSLIDSPDTAETFTLDAAEGDVALFARET